jgi:hypothetical protein
MMRILAWRAFKVRAVNRVDDGLDGFPDIGLQENFFPGIVPPEIENRILGVFFPDGVHLLRRGFVD